ncbi:hypothetical protein J4218_05940 [Candidatus Pacearchaeota archaeon]|nr:hypothetical protein [Candidatus Pacearchaeota archaeon]
MKESIHKKIISGLVFLISFEFLLNASKLAPNITKYQPWILGVLFLIIAIILFKNSKK